MMPVQRCARTLNIPLTLFPSYLRPSPSTVGPVQLSKLVDRHPAVDLYLRLYPRAHAVLAGQVQDGVRHG